MKHLYELILNAPTKTALLAFLLLFTVSCKKDKPVDESCEKWEYEGTNGPDRWVSLCDDYADCSGLFQSPVDISFALQDPTLPALNLNYGNTKTKIEHNGHTVEFIVDAGSSSLILDGATYGLAQFHFHTHSEHTLSGNQLPMEMHLVHQNALTGNRVVVGVLFEEGAENAFLSQFMADLPTLSEPEHKSNETYNPLEVLPSNKSYFTYPGSLTTPPCTQNVIWHVLEQPVSASADQLSQFEARMKENFRPVRPLLGRSVRYFAE